MQMGEALLIYSAFPVNYIRARVLAKFAFGLIDLQFLWDLSSPQKKLCSQGFMNDSFQKIRIQETVKVSFKIPLTPCQPKNYRSLDSQSQHYKTYFWADL